MSNQSEERFVTLYEATYGELLRFAQRRVAGPQAEDVVAETFLVAWRRTADVPEDADDARAWLFGIARNVLLNSHRGAKRRQALAVRLAAVSPAVRTDDAELISRQVDLAAAWENLSAVHQEALALAVLDDLTAPVAAAVLGISPVAFRPRLSRARRALRALRALLDHQPARTTERHLS
ncbi:RNA polymerase sigma factor [Kribbella sp. NPDC026611]|uniref:RNA polymerase sigma factor n=1 Tax=Kribbella sp. NPDC026611 TaxID=3154911 RepID=UPI0033C6FBB8